MDVMKEDESSEERVNVTDSGSTSQSSSAKEVDVRQAVKSGPSSSSPSEDCGKSDDLTRCQLDNRNAVIENSLKMTNRSSDEDPKTVIPIAAAPVSESSAAPFPEPDSTAQLDPFDTTANGIKGDSITSNNTEVSEVARKDLCSDSFEMGGGKGPEECTSGVLEMNVEHNGSTNGNLHPGEQSGNLEHDPAAGSIQELSRENAFPMEIHYSRSETTASIAKAVESEAFIGPAMSPPMLRGPVGEQESPVWATSNDVRTQAAEKVDGDWLGTVEGAETISGIGNHSNGEKGTMVTDLAGQDSDPSGCGTKHPTSSRQEANAVDPELPATLCGIAPSLDSGSPAEKGNQEMKEGGFPHSTSVLEGAHESQDSSESVTSDSKSDTEAVEPDERVAGDSTLLPARTGGPEAAKVVAPAGSQVEACGAEDDAWSTAVTVDANEEDFGDLALLPAGPEVTVTGEGDDLGNEAAANTSRETGTTWAARGTSPTKTREWDPKRSSKPKGANEGVRALTPCPQMQPVAVTEPEPELKSMMTHASEKVSPGSPGGSESATNGRVADDWVEFGDHDVLNTSAPKHEDTGSLAAQSPPVADDKSKNIPYHTACSPDVSATTGGSGDDDWGGFVEVPPPGSTVEETTPEHVLSAVDSMSAGESSVAQKDASQSNNDNSGSAAFVAMDENENRAREGDAKTAVSTKVGENESNDQEEDWGDFGDFEEAPTTVPELPAGIPAVFSINTGPMTSNTAVDAVEVEKAGKGPEVTENGSDWNAFEEPAAIEAPTPTQNVQKSGDVSAANARPGLSSPKSPVPDSTLAVYVAVFNHAFPAESSGTGGRKDLHDGDAGRIPLEALVGEAIITRYSKRWSVLPTRLGKSARLCILRGICPVADSLRQENSDVDIEDVTKIPIEGEARKLPIAAAEASEGVGAVRDVENTSLPVPRPGSAESPTLLTEAAPARREQASEITSVTSEMKYQSSSGVKSPVVEASGQRSDGRPSISNTGDDFSAFPSPKEAVLAVRMSFPGEVTATAAPSASLPLTTLHAGRDDSQPPEQSNVDAAKETSVGHETNDSTGAEDWGGDPFDGFQSAPAVPESKEAESTSFNLISAPTPQPEKAPTIETPTWSLDFFMSGPSSKSARTTSSNGGLTGKPDEPEAVGGISKKPLDLVSQALAGYGIADSPLSVSKEATSQEKKQVSLPRGSETGTRDGGGAPSPTQTPAVDSGANPLADLLRATRIRRNVNVAPLSASAKSRISALPDLSFMLSGRLKFPVVGTMSTSASDSE